MARENSPATRRSRALTQGERKVVALLGLRHSQKRIAYELGISETRVSRLARSAMDKLGVTTRAELIELQGAIVSPAEVDDEGGDGPGPERATSPTRAIVRLDEQDRTEWPRGIS